MAYIEIQLAGDAAPNGIRNSECPRARSATLVSAWARPSACAVDSKTLRKASTCVARPPAIAAAPRVLGNGRLHGLRRRRGIVEPGHVLDVADRAVNRRLREPRRRHLARRRHPDRLVSLGRAALGDVERGV